MWLDDDIESALGWMDYLASLCGGCGNPASETMDPDADGAYESVPLTCFACAARDAENRAVSDARSKESQTSTSFDGLYIGVQKRT